MDLTDEQWTLLEPLIPELPRRSDGRGRPWRPSREILNGILWVLRTGAPWKDLPDRYPPYQACHRGSRPGYVTARSRRSCGPWPRIWRPEGASISPKPSSTVLSCQPRGLCVGKAKRGKGTKIMAIADSAGLAITVHIVSASPNEVRLVEETLDRRFLEAQPEKLIGDKAYDSDSLDKKLRERDIEMIAPNRCNRRKTQDGRPLHRYRRRWKIERLFAWLYNFRRLRIRYEYHAENFLGMVQLGLAVILLRHL